MLNEHDVVIVIPMYRMPQSVFEEVSICQLFKVLDKYHISFVVPESFPVTKLKNRFESYFTVEKFKDSFFVDKESYSSLCLSRSFYDRFSEYRYMLIYQPDAFVFSDRIEEFISMNYDYIGSPLVSIYWKDYHVGNGGLSLRNIHKSMTMLDKFDEIVIDKIARRAFCMYEDLFWGYCGYRDDVDFKVPGIELASSFSVQDDSCDAYKYIKEKGLPFGTHQWMMEDYTYWKPIVEQFGYILPDSGIIKSRNCQKEEAEHRFMPLGMWKYKRLSEDKKQVILWLCGFPVSRRIAIWGNGRNGKRCLRIMQELALDVCAIIDNAADRMQEIEGIPVIRPEAADLNGVLVILTVKGKTYEILKQMREVYSRQPYFLAFDEIEKRLMNVFHEEFPELNEIAEKYKYEKLVEMGVSFDEWF